MSVLHRVSDCAVWYRRHRKRGDCASLCESSPRSASSGWAAHLGDTRVGIVVQFVSRNIGTDQIRLLHRARSFLNARQALGLDTAVDPECCLNSWANVPGNATLRRLAFGWRAELARLIAGARDMASLLRTPGFAVTGYPSVEGEFRQLIVSWALPDDLDADGAHTDRYLRLGSRATPQVLWLLMLLTGSAPARLPDNVRVFHRMPFAGGRVGVPWHLAGRLLRRPVPLGGRSCFRRWSGIVAQAHAVATSVTDELRRGRFRQIVMPYEAQPFQHAINLAVKQYDPGLTTVGYLHSALPALPTELVFRPGAPDRLLVHGVGQAEILTRRLGWPAARLKTIPSLRYLRDSHDPLAGHILLPYSIRNADAVSRTFEAFMRSAPTASMPRWEVRNHPVMRGSPKHAALAQRLRAITQWFPNRMSSDLSHQTIVVGASASVIEALERGLDVVHICTDALFESYSQDIWPNIEVEELQPNVYRYRLRERGSYIQFSDAPGQAAGHLGIKV
jgi:hypothetical protein